MYYCYLGCNLMNDCKLSSNMCKVKILTVIKNALGWLFSPEQFEGNKIHGKVVVSFFLLKIRDGDEDETILLFCLLLAFVVSLVVLFSSLLLLCFKCFCWLAIFNALPTTSNKFDNLSPCTRLNSVNRFVCLDVSPVAFKNTRFPKI